jgi:hypothetical protein
VFNRVCEKVKKEEAEILVYEKECLMISSDTPWGLMVSENALLGGVGYSDN